MGGSDPGSRAQLARHSRLVEKAALLHAHLSADDSGRLGLTLAPLVLDAPGEVATNALEAFPREPVLLLMRGIIRAREKDRAGCRADLLDALARSGAGGREGVLAICRIYLGGRDAPGASPLEEGPYLSLIERCHLPVFFRNDASMHLSLLLGRRDRADGYAQAMDGEAAAFGRDFLLFGTLFFALLPAGALIAAWYGVWLLTGKRSSLRPPAGMSPATVWLIFLLWELGEMVLYLAAHAMGFSLLARPVSIVLFKTVTYALGGIVFLRFALMPSRPEAVGLHAREIPRNVALGAAGYAAAVPPVLLLSYLSQLAFRTSGISSSPIFDYLIGGASPIESASIVFLACVAAPVFEEIVFRGFLFSAFTARWGRGWALFLSSLVFALVHGEAAVLLPVFALGYVLALLYDRTSSLVSSIVCHVLWNSVMLAFSCALLQ